MITAIAFLCGLGIGVGVTLLIGSVIILEKKERMRHEN